MTFCSFEAVELLLLICSHFFKAFSYNVGSEFVVSSYGQPLFISSWSLVGSALCTRALAWSLGLNSWRVRD